MPHKVSIIIPAYNCEEYLADAIESVLSQTYATWECIVVDDGSSDNTSDIAENYAQKDNRISCLHQQNRGLPFTRNIAIAHSTGDYILPLDGDDKIAPTFIEKSVEYFEKHPNTRIVYCRLNLFGAASGEKLLPKYSFQHMLQENCIPATALYRRSDYDRTCGYNENMRHGLEDWDFWISLLDKDAQVHQLDEILFHYRIKQTSMSTTTTKDNYRALFRQICMNHPEKYIEHISDIIIDGQQYAGMLENELQRTRTSRAYRLGKRLIHPFSKLLV